MQCQQLIYCLLSEFFTYATTVERAFDFLINDTGEDGWLCTLMVRVVDGGGGTPVQPHVAYIQEGVGEGSTGGFVLSWCV